MINLGVLISGRGSNFEAIARAASGGRISARIALVVSNREEARGLVLAQSMGLPARFIPSADKSRESFEGELQSALEESRVDYICLAGFMRVLSPSFVRAFPRRIVNIHPSLLPAFPGVDAQRQALEHGVKFSGCTVHFVDEGVDTGPIILQAVVAVADDDTVESLSARILEEEHRIYPEAVRLLAEGCLRFQGRRVVLRKATQS